MGTVNLPPGAGTGVSHYLAVANIDKLFANAIEPRERLDKVADGVPGKPDALYSPRNDVPCCPERAVLNIALIGGKVGPGTRRRPAGESGQMSKMTYYNLKIEVFASGP
jgi:hypothetical protein